MNGLSGFLKNNPSKSNRLVRKIIGCSTVVELFSALLLPVSILITADQVSTFFIGMLVTESMETNPTCMTLTVKQL